MLNPLNSLCLLGVSVSVLSTLKPAIAKFVGIKKVEGEYTPISVPPINNFRICRCILVASTCVAASKVVLPWVVV